MIRKVTCAILAPNSGTESEILSRHLREYDKFYKYEGLMRISEIFLLENLSINVPVYIMYFYAILFYFVEYGIPLSQIKIVLFILANRECLIRRRRCINILFIFAGQWKARVVPYWHQILGLSLRYWGDICGNMTSFINTRDWWGFLKYFC
jgi:hypothetical protein